MMPLVLVYAGGRKYQFVAVDVLRSSYFGGPLSAKVTGIPHGPRMLHQIAFVSAADIPILREHFVSLPLLYGMQFDGCSLTYRLTTALEEIEVTKLEPTTSSDSWPYPNYPAHLPYYQLAIAEATDCSWKDFSDSLPNAPSTQRGTVYAVVPPPMTIGFSLWGRDGDDEGVHLAWEFDAKSRVVTAYNLCT